MKRKIAFILALLLLSGVFATLPVGAVGANTIYKYTENSDGTLTITEYTGKSALVSVPGTLDGKQVSAVGDRAFAGLTNILRVYIGEGVTAIGASAFAGCSSLLEVELPDSLTTIGNSAFSRCDSLEFVVIPQNVKSIGDSAFSGCKKLSDIVFIDSPAGAVYGTSSLGSARIFAPAGSAVAKFASATSLEFATTSSPSDFKYKQLGITCTITEYKGDARAIVIPQTLGGLTVVALAEQALSAAAGHAKNAEIVVFPKTLQNIPASLCRESTALRYVSMPQTISAGIGRDAFHGCSSLVSVRIPLGTTDIFDSAFRDCTSLSTVIFDDCTPNISYEAFRDCKSLATLICPGDQLHTPSGSLASMVAFSGVSKNAVVYTDNDSVWDLKNGKWSPDFTVSLAVKRIDASCIHTETIITPATCAIKGESEMSCRFCGDSYKIAHPIVEHDYISTGVVSGIASFYCRNCISNYTRRHVSACTYIATIDNSLPEGSRVTSLSLKFKGDTMTLGTDYTYTELYNSHAGRTVLIITGIGDYIGTLNLTYVDRAHNWTNFYTVTADGCSGEGHYVPGDIVMVVPQNVPDGYEPSKWVINGAEILSAGVGGATFVMPSNDVSVSFELVLAENTTPPVTEPPITDRPADTEPPVTEAPVTDPPETEKPADTEDPYAYQPPPPDRDAYVARWIILGCILVISFGGMISLCAILFRRD